MAKNQELIDLAKIYFMQVDEMGDPLWSLMDIVNKVNTDRSEKGKKSRTSNQKLTKGTLFDWILRYGWKEERQTGLIKIVRDSQNTLNQEEEKMTRKILDQLGYFNRQNVVHTGDLLKMGTAILLRMMNNTRLYLEAVEQGDKKKAAKLSDVMLYPKEITRVVEATGKQMEAYSDRFQSMLLDVDQQQVEADIRRLLTSVDGLSGDLGDLGKLIDMEVEDE